MKQFCNGFNAVFTALSIACAAAAWWLLLAAGLNVPLWLMAASWAIFVAIMLFIDWHVASHVSTPTAKQLDLLRRYFDAQGEQKKQLGELVAAERPNCR